MDSKKVKKILKNARTSLCGYVVTAEHPAEKALETMFREVKRMDGMIREAIALLPPSRSRARIRNTRKQIKTLRMTWKTRA